MEFTNHENALQITGNGDRDKFIASVKPIVESEDKFQIFERWLLENGSKFPKLELKDYGDEVRGCHAIQEINDDEIIVEIPLNCLITVEMGKETDVGNAIIASNIELDAPKHIFLMLFMLVDRKRPNSFFKPYYDILPATLSNMPIFWRDEELDYLRGSYLLIQIDERKLAIENDYISICAIYPEFANIATLEEFSWARMCVCSRNFGMTINGLRTAALVPYADMLNHYRPRETKWQYDDDRNGFTVISLQGISTGSPVYDSYGQKCNHRFLLNYGFSIENNVESDGYCPNETPILLQLKREDPLYDRKCSFWSRDGSFPVRRLRISVCENDTYRMMISMLRIIVIDEDDFQQIMASYGGGPYRNLRDTHYPLNYQNEVRVLHHLLSILKDYLGRYPTTLVEDIQRLSSGTLAPFSNERHAVIQVRGEKEVLAFYVGFAEAALRLLTIPFHVSGQAEFEVLLQEYRNSQHNLTYQYCRNVVARVRLDEIARLEMFQKNVDLSRSTIV